MESFIQFAQDVQQTAGDSVFGTVLTAGLGMIVAPISQIIHNKLPGEFEILQPSYSLILSVLFGLAMRTWLFPEMTNVDVVVAVLSSQVISQFALAGWQSKDRLKKSTGE